MILDSYHVDLEKFSTQADYIYSVFFLLLLILNVLVSSHSGAKVNQNKKYYRKSCFFFKHLALIWNQYTATFEISTTVLVKHLFKLQELMGVTCTSRTLRKQRPTLNNITLCVNACVWETENARIESVSVMRTFQFASGCLHE